jgi:hypothetical protein
VEEEVTILDTLLINLEVDIVVEEGCTIKEMQRMTTFITLILTTRIEADIKLVFEMPL